MFIMTKEYVAYRCSCAYTQPFGEYPRST